MEMMMNYNNGNESRMLPPGFRFHPTDEELITYYLVKKVFDTNFTGGRAIAEVDLNKCEPWELPEKAKMGEKEWYFYNLRDRKYPTGLRTNRATEAGYWKATGKDREIYNSCNSLVVGMKKTLVFYKGRAPRGLKTNWVMHEYRLGGNFAYYHNYLSRPSKDEWVVSRVFQKSGAGGAVVLPPMSTGGEKKKKMMMMINNTSSHDHIINNSSPESTNNKLSKEHVPCFSTMSMSTASGSNFMKCVNKNIAPPFNYFPSPIPDLPPSSGMNNNIPHQINNPITIMETFQMPFLLSNNNAAGIHSPAAATGYYEMNDEGGAGGRIGFEPADDKFDNYMWGF